MTDIIHRELELDQRKVNVDARTVQAVLSTETGVSRGDYTEVLPHTVETVDMQRADKGLPLIESHDSHKLNIGKVENIRLEDGQMLGDVRFGRSARANEVFNDVADGIVSGVSIGYIVRDWDTDSETKTWTARSWMPFEVSAVSIPADTNAGFLRSIGAEGLSELPVVALDEAESVEDPIQAVEEPDPPPNRAIENNQNEPPKGGFFMEKEMSEESTQPETVNVEAVQDEARKAERARVSVISAMGEKFDKAELARTFIDNGRSASEFQGAILDDMDTATVNVPTSITSDSLGVSQNEQREYSFMNLIRALANPTDRKAQEDAGLEFEVSAAFAEKRGSAPKGAWVPDDMMMKRTDLLADTTTQGGHTVATDLKSEDFITALGNVSAVVRAGATVFPGLQRGDIAIPAQTNKSAVVWTAENVAKSETNPTFRQVTLSPTSMGGFVDISRKLLLQSDHMGGIDNFVQRDLFRALATELDRVCIEGDPDTTATADEPRGVIQVSGIGSVAGGTNGAAPDRDDIVNLVTAIAQDNALLGSPAFLMNSVTIGKLMRTKLDTGSGQFLMESRNSIHGFPVFESNNVPADLSKGSASATCSAILFGNWADLLIASWSGTDILVDPYTGGTAGTLRIIAQQDVDTAVRHAESFSAMLDALTT